MGKKHFIWYEPIKWKRIQNQKRLIQYSVINRLKFVLDYFDKEIRNIVLKAKQKLDEVDKRIKAHADSFVLQVEKINRDSEAIIQKADNFTGSVSHNIEIDVPELDVLSNETTQRREGVSKFAIGLLGGVALMAINTFLLNQFFASFISMHVIGIPVSIILSFFFSFLEAVLGVVLYYQQKKH